MSVKAVLLICGTDMPVSCASPYFPAALDADGPIHVPMKVLEQVLRRKVVRSCNAR